MVTWPSLPPGDRSGQPLGCEGPAQIVTPGGRFVHNIATIILKDEAN
jgi:hypothetical protein